MACCIRARGFQLGKRNNALNGAFQFLCDVGDDAISRAGNSMHERLGQRPIALLILPAADPRLSMRPPDRAIHRGCPPAKGDGGDGGIRTLDRSLGPITV